MRLTVALVALVIAGCASWTVLDLLTRADRLAATGDLDGALRAYDEALARGADGRAGMRAHAGRTSVTVALAAREEMHALRASLERREIELARLRADVAARAAELERLSRDLRVRDGELSRVRQDLSSRQAELARMGHAAEQLRLDLESLKRLEMRLERRR